MDFVGYKIDKGKNNKSLLIVGFTEDGKEITWVPKWVDLCTILEVAAVVETMNTSGLWNEQYDVFVRTSSFVGRLCKTVKTVNEFRGDL